MASTIKLKNGSGAPTAGDLVQGEPALDLTNKRLYTEDSGGTVLEIGTNPTSITTGTFTSTGIDDNATSTAITIDNSGNVGIGVTSPAKQLEVQNAAAGTAIRASNSGGGYAELACTSNATSTAQLNFTNSLAMLGGNVGIGTSSPSAGAVGGKVIHVQNSGGTASVRVDRSDAATSGTLSMTSGDGSNGLFSTGAKPLAFAVNSTERMRIDSSGNLLVGKTTTSNATAGAELNASGQIVGTLAGGTHILGRNTNDGSILELQKDGTPVGSIGVEAGIYPYIGGNAGGSGDVFLIFISNTTQSIRPATAAGASRDNAIDLGASSARFDDIYATNALIQTSDRNEKQDIAELSDAEQRVAVACKGLLRKFRWKDAVEEKGDDARIHFGIIAQDLQSAFEAEGLDAGDYAMFISSTWYEKEITVDAVEAVYEDVVVTPAQEAGFREVSPEVQAEPAYYDVDGNEIKAAVEYQAAVHEATEAVEEVTEQRLVSEAKEAYTYTDTSEEPKEGYTARTRLGVRYPELLSFIIAAV